MKPDIENATKFGRFAAALDLTAEQKAFAWDAMTKSGVGNSEVEAVFFCILAKMDGLMSAMNGDLEEAMSRFHAELKASLTEEMKRLLAAIPKTLLANMDKDRKAFMEALIKDFEEHAEKLGLRLAQIHQRKFVSQFLGGAVLVTVLSLGVGYVIGRDAGTAQVAEVQGFMKRSDVDAIALVVENNDFTRLLADCKTFGKFEANGRPACQPTIFLGQGAATKEGVNGLALLWTQFTLKVGSWGLMGVGGVLGVLLSRWWGNRKRNGY